MVEEEIGEIVALVVGLVVSVVAFSFVEEDGAIVSLTDLSNPFVVVANFIPVFFGHHLGRDYKKIGDIFMFIIN